MAGVVVGGLGPRLVRVREPGWPRGRKEGRSRRPVRELRGRERTVVAVEVAEVVRPLGLTKVGWGAEAMEIVSSGTPGGVGEGLGVGSMVGGIGRNSPKRIPKNHQKSPKILKSPKVGWNLEFGSS